MGRQAGFNPRLRTGGDLLLHHAAHHYGRFNPRLRTGGDPCAAARLPVGKKSQSTPPHGRRRFGGARRRDLGQVSIHASAREATAVFSAPPTRPSGFNPRLRTGGDKTSYIGLPNLESFNPRLRTGGDVCHRLCQFCARRFNPRLRTGGDYSFGGANLGSLKVSIHASAREATCIPFCGQGRAVVFQSTPPHGRRLRSGLLHMLCRAVSIHASAREATFASPDRAWELRRFNPRLRTGGDHFQPPRASSQHVVSIHASAREATGAWYGR